jgi:peptidoglycan/xylan/chitin deacetylase (PgdA/CDA1 family)
MSIKHTIRDNIIFLISILGIAFVYRYILRKKSPLVRIIAFHDVVDGVWFESIIKMINERYLIITPDQFHAKEFNQEKINILFTFDDGYQSWTDVCLPILTKYNTKGLFFINSGLLDCSDDSIQSAQYMKERLFITPKKPLTWNGAKKILKEGHTIGGHSVGHYNLAKLNQSKLKDEISNDKKKIEKILDITLTDFAYPFGRKNNYNSNIFGVVEQTGYTWQYSAQSRFATEDVVIPRMLVEKMQSVLKLHQWIEGGYDIFERLH